MAAIPFDFLLRRSKKAPFIVTVTHVVPINIPPKFNFIPFRQFCLCKKRRGDKNNLKNSRAHTFSHVLLQSEAKKKKTMIFITDVTKIVLKAIWSLVTKCFTQNVQLNELEIDLKTDDIHSVSN